MSRKETDVAKPIIPYLQDLQWTVYQEVRPRWGGPVADLVGVQDTGLSHPLIWVVEVKVSLSLDLIAQALDWKRDANFISIAIPNPKKGKKGYRDKSRGRLLAEKILRDNGIGLMEVEMDHFIGSAPDLTRVKPLVDPKLHRRKRFSLDWTEVLQEEHKSFSEAGSVGGGYWTPFKKTCREVLSIVTKEPGTTMNEIVSRLKEHHYSSDQSARSCLRNWIAEGKVPGVTCVREKNRFTYFPEGHPEAVGTVTQAQGKLKI